MLRMCRVTRSRQWNQARPRNNKYSPVALGVTGQKGGQGAQCPLIAVLAVRSFFAAVWSSVP